MSDDQKPTPNTLPQRKVTAGLVAGGTVSVIIWALKTFANVDVSADAAVGMTAIFTFLVQYFVPNVEN